jgi:hypothetical protein
MEIAEALEDWREFYLLVGTAGATLVALLFVAVSLGTGYLTQERAEATRTFFSPVVVHFAGVFFLSCVALVPSHTSLFFAAAIGATALAGLGVSVYAMVKFLSKYRTPYWSDHFAYYLLPILGYCALMSAAVLAYVESDYALEALGGSLLLLLLVNIRNAWDLVLEMVRRHPTNAG